MSFFTPADATSNPFTPSPPPPPTGSDNMTGTTPNIVPTSNTLSSGTTPMGGGSPMITPGTSSMDNVIGTHTNPMGSLGMGTPTPMGTLPAGTIHTSTSRPIGTGNVAGGSSSRIDGDQMPRPLGSYTTKTVTYTASMGQQPLPSLYSQQMYDAGNSSPRFMRSTLYAIPSTSGLLKSSTLPFGMIIQPFAEPGPGEAEVPIVNMGAIGPVRCSRCKGYLNPFFTFGDGGRMYKCVLCSFQNEVPGEYFCPLDPSSNRRHDFLSRAELSKGSFDILAPKEYVFRPPSPPAYVFVVDVSMNALRNGLMRLFVQSVSRVLPLLPSNARVAFITFDSTIHFYNLSKDLEQPQMLVVADIESPFLPLGEGLLVEYKESCRVVDTLLERLPTMFSTSDNRSSALGAAITAATSLLQEGGGKVFTLGFTLPTLGAGSLKPRITGKEMGTDKEGYLYKPQTKFYSKLAATCIEQRTTHDIFFFSDQYTDIATIQEVCTLTGGSVYHYPGFASSPPLQRKFARDLERNITRPTVYDAVLKIRCSSGVEATSYYGSFSSKDQDLHFPTFHCDNTFGVSFSIEEKLESTALIQCAVLYTNEAGERRIRVHNLQLPCTSSLSDVYGRADCEATTHLLARQALSQVTKRSIKGSRTYLINSMIGVLSTYRQKCSSSGGGSLVLPEPLKTLPLYVLSLLKSELLNLTTYMSPDQRACALSYFTCTSVHRISARLYPRLMRVDTLGESVLPQDPAGVLQLPPPMRLARDSLSHEGAYLLDDGEFIYLWFGRDVSPHYIAAIFGSVVFTGDTGVKVKSLTVPLLDNVQSINLNNMVKAMRNTGSKTQCLYVLHPSFVSASLEKFWNLMVEDKSTGQVGYADFLVRRRLS